MLKNKYLNEVWKEIKGALKAFFIFMIVIFILAFIGGFFYFFYTLMNISF